MAVRFDGSGESLSRSASGLAGASRTWAAWMLLDSDLNNFTYYLGADDGASGWELLGFGNDGTTPEFTTTLGAAIGPGASTGIWYYFVGVYDLGTGTAKLYAGQEGYTGVELLATASVTPTLADSWTFWVGNDGFNERLDGRVAHVRVWTAALTQAEIEAEITSVTPVRTSGLWGAYPLVSDYDDISGNGRHLTSAGTLAFVAGPDLPSATDSFDRANTTGANMVSGGHDRLGVNWDQYGNADWNEGLYISSNEATCAPGEPVVALWHEEVVDPTDCGAAVSWWTGQGEIVGPVVNDTGSALATHIGTLNGYFIDCRYWSNSVQLYKGATQIGNYNGPAAWGDVPRWVRFRIKRLGSSIKLFLTDGGVETEIISYTDVSPLTGTYIGMGVLTQNGGNPRLNDWAGYGTGATVATAPAQVTGLTVASTRPGQLQLSWTAPADGGSAITDYLIEQSPDGSTGWTTVSDGTSTATSYTHTGLTNGTAVHYRVSAINAIGTGTASSVVSNTPTRHPWVVAWATEGSTSLGSANAQPLPTGAQAGDLAIHFVGNDNTSTTNLSASTGWEAATQQTQGSNVIKGRVFARLLDGTTGNNILSVTGAAQDYSIVGCIVRDHGVTDVATWIASFVAGAVSASNGNANPPNLNPGSSDDRLWLAAAIIDATTGSTISVDPTNYATGAGVTSANSTSSCVTRAASRRLTASSEDPGTFTNTSRPWIAFTVGVPPFTAAVTLVGTWGMIPARLT